MKQFLLIFVILALAVAQIPAYTTQVIYNPIDNDDLIHRLQGQKATPAQKQEADEKLIAALGASLKEHPTMASTGHRVTELHPPVKVVIGRAAKIRRIPHPSGEIVRRVPVGTPLVATASTPDLLWLRVNEDEYVPTRDCRFSFPEESTSAPVLPIEPPLDVHVADRQRVLVHKIPNTKGKAVGYLNFHDRVKIIGVTPDYTWAQIGHKQFVSLLSLKTGDPLIRLDPPLTVHAVHKIPVYDMPTHKETGVEGSIVSTLEKDDIFSAIATTSDYEWLKLASGAYVKTEDTHMGEPHPEYTVFPKPMLIKIHPKECPVIKNPNKPDIVIRKLYHGDQLQVFGVTNDFKWLVVAHHRYIPLHHARMVSPLAKEVPLTPPVLIKLNKPEIIRHIPDPNGRVMTKAGKGDQFEAIAVTEDFTWLKLADRQWIPLTSAHIRREPPQVRVLATPLRVTLRTDTTVYKRPDFTSKKVKTHAAGSAVTVVAATPDAEWLKITDKEYFPAESAVLIPVPETAPLTPPITAVVVKDAKIYQSPDPNSIIVKRLPRGEIIKVVATTTDLKWLALGDNMYINTEFVAHIPSLITLQPPVRFVVAPPQVKARNVPAFSGMGVQVVKKGTVIVATETTIDYKWVKIGESRYLPTSALLLHEEEENNDIMAVLRLRTGETQSKPQRLGGKVTPQSLAPRLQNIEVTTTTPLGAKQIGETLERYNSMSTSQYNHMDNHVPTQSPSSAMLQKVTKADNQPVKQVRVIADTPVMNAARSDATQVKTLRKGTFVTVFAADKSMKWLQIGPSEFILLTYTDIADQVKQHQL